jgi:hypothetical protein
MSMMRRDWYRAPRLQRDEVIGVDEASSVAPYTGPASNGEPHMIGGMICRAYNPTGNGGNVMVGVPAGTPVPDDWVLLPLQAARAHFVAVTGRAAKPGEVE